MVVPDGAAQWHEGDPRVGQWQPPTSWKQAATAFAPGFELLSAPADVELQEWEEYAVAWEGLPGVCYAVVSWSGEIEDLDVRVFAHGTLVAQDVRPDVYPVAEWCVDRRTAMQATVRAHAGAGSARVGVLVDINQREAASGPRDELSNRLMRAVSQSAPRWVPARDQWRHRFGAAGLESFEVATTPGSCYTVVAVGESTVLDVDARLLDPEGVEVALDTAADAWPALTWCSPSGGPWEVELALVRGEGSVAATVLQAPAP